jgi:ABC-type multidrug transport system fused ATPase/permease subunit
MFLASFHFLVPPFVLGKIVDFFSHYQANDSLVTFYLYASFLAVFLAVNSLINLAYKNYFTLTSIDAAFTARVKGFEKLMNFSLFWHESDSSGAKVQRLQTGSASLNHALSFFSKTLLSWVAKFVGVFGVFLFLDLKFFCFSAGFLLVFFSVTWFFYRKMEVANNELNRAKEAAAGRYYECTSNVLTVKSLGAVDTIKTGVSDHEERVKAAEQKTVRLHFWQWRIYQIVKALGTFVFLLLVADGVVSKTLTVGFIFTYYHYYLDLTVAAGSTASNLNELIKVKNDIARMMPIFWSTPSITQGRNTIPTTWNRIDFVDAQFSYQGNGTDFALKNLNFSVQRNQKIGIAGGTGSGKSTVAKLLLGLYPLDSGRVKFDDVDLKSLRDDEISDHISVVLQESELFNLSFKENITLLKKVEPALLEQAVRVAQLEDVVEKLPQGLDTLIGEKGYKLSGGERQRVGIARAICRSAEIIIFDEATSALDSKTEQLIHSAIEQELQDKTLIIIAHRIGTLKSLDQLYVFDRGQIVECGTYAELMGNKHSHLFNLNRAEANSVNC